MSQALKNLLTLLNPEKIEEGPFCGQSEDLSLRQVSGGQAMDQALYAAKETVPGERLVHSFHSYFLRPGDSKKPIICDVKTLRNGDSFNVCRVSATQSGKPVFYMTASSQAPEAGFEHQKITSSTPAPNGLPSETQVAQSLVHLPPLVLKDKFICDRPLEVHPVEFHNLLKGYVAEPYCQVWTYANGSVPDDPHAHQYLLGYASDPNFLPVALQPHGIGFFEPGIQIATIDYSMWSHRPFNLNEWLLYSVKSTSVSGVRDFMRGELYIQDDMLVALTIQEEVMCNHNQKNSRR